MIDITCKRDIVLEYSDNPEVLNEILNDIKVKISYYKCDRYFDVDDEYRDILNVKIDRNKQSIRFKFGCSINDTIKNKLHEIEYYNNGDTLYTILCSMKYDYYCDDDIKTFADNYGFDFDIQGYSYINKIFQKCLKHSEKLQSIFDETEIECFPY